MKSPYDHTDENPPRIKWEPIDSVNQSDGKMYPSRFTNYLLWRHRTPNGWLVKSKDGGILYVPDDEGSWMPNGALHRQPEEDS